MDKFKNKLPKDDLKRFAKDVAKQLVKSDFKHRRVDDPTKISEKQEKQVKKFVKEYFDKAVTKKAEHDRKKADKKAKEGGSAPGGTTSMTPDQTLTVEKLDVTDVDEEIQKMRLRTMMSSLSISAPRRTSKGRENQMTFPLLIYHRATTTVVLLQKGYVLIHLHLLRHLRHRRRRTIQ